MSKGGSTMETVIIQNFTFNLNPELLFSDGKGRIKDSIRKNKLKKLEKLAPLLSKVIAVDETILFVFDLTAPMPFLEQLTMGWYLHYIKKSVFIMTDRKIVHAYVSSSGKPRNMIRIIHYGDIKTHKLSTGIMSGNSLTLRYANQQKETFLYVKEDGKKLVRHLKEFAGKAAVGAPFPSPGGPGHVCPQCIAPLQEGVYRCTACFQLFKDESSMVRWSIIMPGGGYFYTGYYFLAFGDFIAEALLLVFFLVCLVAGDLVSALIWGGLLAFEKLVTIYHGKSFIRSFIPMERKDAPPGIS